MSADYIADSDKTQTCTDTERAVAALWSEVLQIPEPPSVTDDFFLLGGNSMTMVMTEFRVMEEFAVELQPGSLLGAPTVREFAALIEATR